MVDKDFVRLQHMLDSASAISSFIKGKNRSNLDSDRLLLSGILRELEIIGEAAGKVSQQTQDCFQDVPWKQMVGMRNRLIHAYFEVDHDIVWNTVTQFVPSLATILQKIVSNY